jgi:octopine/nopaline transport system permease protein
MSSFDLFDLSSFGAGGWGVALLKAALTTTTLSIAGFLAGAAVGGLAAFARLAGGRVASAASYGYSTLFRGVPDLLTIYLLYFGGSVGLTIVGNWLGAQGFIGLPAFSTGVLALAVISGAYQAEVYRGAFLAIHRGELDAARAFGMSGSTMLRRVVGPQVLRYALPGLGNVWQLVLKDSALVSVTGLVELMRQAQVGAGSTRQPFAFYSAAAALYFAIALLTGALFRSVERRSLRGVRIA